MVEMKLCVGNMLRFYIISWKHGSGHEIVSNKSPLFTHDFFLRLKRFHIQFYNFRPARSHSFPYVPNQNWWSKYVFIQSMIFLHFSDLLH